MVMDFHEISKQSGKVAGLTGNVIFRADLSRVAYPVFANLWSGLTTRTISSS